VVGPGLLHRIISEVQRRYDVADQRRSRDISLNDARGAGLMEMPLLPEQEALCEQNQSHAQHPQTSP
jgi:hypothetical protein